MMTEIPKVRFVLAVLDLRRSTAWYTSVLGPTIDFEPTGWSFLSRPICGDYLVARPMTNASS